MNTVDLIEKKKQKKELSSHEIAYLINGYATDTIPDYQMAAFLMAGLLQGMSPAETFAMTDAMRFSGEQVDLSAVHGIKVDKHSTGGVGDSVTLLLGPIVAALGVPVVKMSGRGLGHTGGTLDKLAAIPGMQTDLTLDEIVKQANQTNLVICGQTNDVTPADKKIYALRDVTATVDYIPYIASSIMSKKLAMGCDAILLDVKVGKGAFMKSLTKARQLAHLMVDIGHKAGVDTTAYITDMEEPLSHMIGNYLEVWEVMEILQGRKKGRLLDLSLQLAGEMLVMAKCAHTLEEGVMLAQDAIDEGKAWNAFLSFVKAQGGDVDALETLHVKDHVRTQVVIEAPESGYITDLDALAIGQCAYLLGAGRMTKESPVDLFSGVELKVQRGMAIAKGDPLGILYTNRDDVVAEVCEHFLSAIKIESHPSEEKDLILDVIS